MSWTAYRVVLRLSSPLHVGYLKTGNLMRTRHYVPGKTLWGALTARLTRDFPALRGDYHKVGDRVNQELAFSYFYPAINPDHPLYPNYTSEGLRYGPEGDDPKPLSPDEFSWRLLSSYASTALNAQQASAEEGSLHEVEFISPHDKETGELIYLVGYIFERSGYELRWRDTLDRLQLGGERKYGWGRVCPVKVGRIEQDSVELFGRYSISLGDENLLVTVPEGRPLLAHTKVEGVQARGQIEPLLGRETQDADQFGNALMPKAQICWVPGSQVQEKIPLSISKHGVWCRLEA